MEPSVPKHWTKGQLLDLRRYGDGSYKATIMGEDPKPELANFVEFDNSFDAQNFISTWYARESVGGVHG